MTACGWLNGLQASPAELRGVILVNTAVFKGKCTVWFRFAVYSTQLPAFRIIFGLTF